MFKHSNLQFTTIFLFILIGSISRIIPHAPNVTPIGAICIFGASHFTKKSYAFFVPLIIIFLSDLFINNIYYSSGDFILFYNGVQWQYLSYVLIIIFSSFFLRPNLSFLKVGLTAISSSLIFFIISNFGVWVSSGIYQLNFIGFILCYFNALPFYFNNLLSFVFYSYVLVGTFYLFQKKFKIIKPKHLLYV